jgi:hypothetical protein
MHRPQSAHQTEHEYTALCVVSASQGIYQRSVRLAAPVTNPPGPTSLAVTVKATADECLPCCLCHACHCGTNVKPCIPNAVRLTSQQALAEWAVGHQCDPLLFTGLEDTIGLRPPIQQAVLHLHGTAHVHKTTWLSTAQQNRTRQVSSTDAAAGTHTLIGWMPSWVACSLARACMAAAQA